MTVIEFNKTSHWFGEVIALNEVSFKIKNGITGLVGSNGAGKTTSIKLIASLLKPTLGSVTINGATTWQNYNFMRNMGYAPEVDRIYGWITGRKFMQLMCRMHGMNTNQAKNRTNIVLHQIGMSHAADRKINGYSRGMRQRIKVGSALLNEPNILLIDEPMAGTDPIGRNILATLFESLVEEDNITIVVSSHVLHELEKISDRIIMLESGKLVAEGTVSGVRKALSKIPHQVRISCDDAILLAEKIASEVVGLQMIDPTTLIVDVADREKLSSTLYEVAEKYKIKIEEMSPLDEDLSTIFKLLKSR